MMPDTHLIKSVDLAADSRRQARYYVRLYELPHGSGYVVSKLSGPAGKEKASEEWFRPTLPLAEKKLAAIVRVKSTRTVGRQYRETPASSQLSLW
jgi:hypothetical protein